MGKVTIAMVSAMMLLGCSSGVGSITVRCPTELPDLELPEEKEYEEKPDTIEKLEKSYPALLADNIEYKRYIDTFVGSWNTCPED